jgi:RNA polymerase sigma-70 factor (ECF subfamily)
VPETDHQVDTKVVWTQMRDRLLAFVRPRVATVQDAEDIVQDVFLRMHAKLDQLQDAERLTPWLYSIARNAIVDYHRKRATKAGTFAKLVDANAADQDNAADIGPTDASAGLAQCTAELMDRLPERQRQALALTELQGLTQQQAAEQLGLSVPGVKARVQRGRRQLKQLLLDCCKVDLDRRQGVVDYEPREDGDGCDQCACE